MVTVDASRIATDLRGLLTSSQVIDAPTDLLNFSYDSSFYSHFHARPPDIAVIARSTDDVAATVRYAYEREIPVIPRGAATAQTGGAIAVYGGIVISMNAMNRVLDVDVPNLQVMTEPGVIHARLNMELAKHKLIFP